MHYCCSTSVHVHKQLLRCDCSDLGFKVGGRAIRNVLSDKAAEATNINIATPPPTPLQPLIWKILSPKQHFDKNDVELRLE